VFKETADASRISSATPPGTTELAFKAFREPEAALLGVTQEYQTITFQPFFHKYSLEELRLSDYRNESKTRQQQVDPLVSRIARRARLQMLVLSGSKMNKLLTCPWGSRAKASML
jgi:hypothetical protein